MLTIACAANMQFAIAEIVKTFEEQEQIKCEVILGSSGKLTAQILEGAPYDIFVSADTVFPNLLHDKKLASSAPMLYATGHLVLWTMDPDLQLSLESLTSQEIQHIALANPKTAPYGVASIEILERLDIFSKLKGKIVYGESIAQVNQFVSTRASEVGITSKSVVMSKQMKDKGKWIDIPIEYYSAIPQAFTIIGQTPSSTEEAEKFALFMTSQECQDILQSFGYST